MGNNKKTMFISGIIGIGIGLFISGIMLSFLIYNVNNKLAPNITHNEHINNADLITKPEVGKPENTAIDIEPKDIKINEIEEKANEEKIIIQPEITTIEPETIEIEIQEAASAREIAHLLEQEGIIADANEFLSYIVSKKAARTLIHGSKIFEINSDYETALKILMTYE